MFFEKIKSPGLAHNSYIIGDKTEGAIIDPRRDVEIYLKKARENGFKIKYVLETHRNEDYVIGSRELEKRTKANVFHADKQFDYRYGKPIKESQTFSVGELSLEAIATPGHTPGSMSYLLKNYENENYIVFTGDTLFSGGVGRVDLYNEEKLRENAANLFESINKLLELGNEVIMCPAHGAGSVCAESIEDREWTTIGIEKNQNPFLSLDKESFVEEAAIKLERPPYFRKMEEMNLNPPVIHTLPYPTPLSAQEFFKETKPNQVLDTRKELCYGSAHVPGSQFIWEDGISSFAGWFLDYDSPISLVIESSEQLEKVVRKLIRIGYDNIDYYLAKGMVGWHTTGYDSDSIETITVQELCKKIDSEKSLDVLDVRGEKEIEEKGRIEDSTEIHLTQLSKNLNKVEELENPHVFCGSGLRSMIAASFLKNNGIKNTTVVLGGLSGWESNKKSIK